MHNSLNVASHSFKIREIQKKALGDWRYKSVGDKNWANFKLYFKGAQGELKAIHAPMMQQVSYHHASMLDVHLCEDMASRDTSMITMVQ